MTKSFIGPKAQNLPTAVCVLGLALAAVSVSAAQSREHGAHTHGVSQLDVALSGDELKLALTIPGADAVGFEHTPNSDQDKAAVKSTLAKLEKAAAMFTLPGAAQCRIEKVEVRAGELGGGHEEHRHDADLDHKEDAAKKVRTEAEGAHKEAHDDAHHTEFEGHYQFHCAKPGQLDTITVGIFTAFPSITQINARVLTPRGQSAQTLTAGAPRLGL